MLHVMYGFIALIMRGMGVNNHNSNIPLLLMRGILYQESVWSFLIWYQPSFFYSFLGVRVLDVLYFCDVWVYMRKQGRSIVIVM